MKCTIPMGDIKKGVKFDLSQTALIKSKLADKKFSHKNWKDKDLTQLRKFIRDYYKIQQEARCSYCRNQLSLTSVFNCHIEHIAPKSKYRDFIFESKNLCVICADCNQIKRDQEAIDREPDPIKKGNKRKRYPRTSEAFKIVHPHFDNYDDHIAIFSNKYYVDKTEKGGFTILSCKLNRHLHVFGWRREIIENSSIMELMNNYLNEKNSIKQSRLLDELRHFLLLT